MSIFKSVYRSLSVLLFAGLPLMAQSDSASNKDSTSRTKSESVSLDAVTITATSRHDLERQSLSNPYKVEKSLETGTQILTQKDIEALAPKDVFDLLDKATGLNVTYQGRKNPYFIDVRGGGSLTYILDGAVLPTSSNRILQKIPMAAIEEIKIVRGSTSLGLGPSIPIGSSNSGSGVNTGFVIIRTKQPHGTEAKMSGFIEKTSGMPDKSDDLPMAHGENVYVGTQFKSHATKGFLSGLNGYVGGMLSSIDYPSTQLRFDATSSDAAMLTGGISYKTYSLGFTAYKDNGLFQMQRGVTVLGTLDNSKWYYDPLKTTILTSNLSLGWTKNQVTMMSLFYTEYEQNERDESFADTIAKNSKKFKENTDGFSFLHNAQFFTNTKFSTRVQPGFQITGSNGNGSNTSNSFNDWRTSVYGWSASIEQSVFDVASINMGYRWDRKHIDTSATSLTKVAANNDKNLPPSQIFAIGAQGGLKDYLIANVCYYNGNEGVSGDFDIKTKNGKKLEPDEQNRIEVSLRSNWKKYLSPCIIWFNVNMKNQKSATTDTYIVDGSTYYYYTQSDALRRGIELLAEGEIKASGTAYNFAWTHMVKNETKDATGKVSDALGLSSPNNLYTFSISQAWRNYLIANISLKRVDPWTSSTSNMGTAYNVHLGDYFTIDANIMKDFLLDNHKVTAKLYGRNITNEKYATRYSTGYYYARGRTLGMELSLAL